MTYAVVDLETGSLSPKSGALVSIAIVFMNDNLNINGHYYSVIKDFPDKTLENTALEINGFTREQISLMGRNVEEVMDEVYALLKNKIIVNHNSAFDCMWLNERGFDIRNSIDTLLLSRRLWPGQKNSLTFACERANVPVEGAHNSLYDARMTAKLLQYFSRFSELNALKPTEIVFKTA